jgi:hypothetical protein
MRYLQNQMPSPKLKESLQKQVTPQHNQMPLQEDQMPSPNLEAYPQIDQTPSHHKQAASLKETFNFGSIPWFSSASRLEAFKIPSFQETEQKDPIISGESYTSSGESAFVSPFEVII